MATRLTPIGTLSILTAFVVVVIAFSTAVLGISNNLDHTDIKHPEAPAIRARHKARLCKGEELWYSPIRGTILILCGLPDSPDWGGLVYRVTENGGEQILGRDEAYECTVFAAPRQYWDEKIGRDGYFPLAWRPDLSRVLREMWGW